MKNSLWPFKCLYIRTCSCTRHGTTAGCEAC